MALSERQQNILNFLQSFIADMGYPPTIREIGEAVNISSTSVVNYNLNVLQREGYIFRDKTVSRGIKIADAKAKVAFDTANLISVPLLGHIAAGQPIDVPADAYASEDTIDVPRHMINAADVYALRVKGDSMIDALINDGDIVIMKHVTSADNGDMVAAWLTDRDETTLKRFYSEGDQVRLQPENTTMQPIYVASEFVQIQGRVVAVLRSVD